MTTVMLLDVVDTMDCPGINAVEKVLYDATYINDDGESDDIQIIAYNWCDYDDYGNMTSRKETDYCAPTDWMSYQRQTSVECAENRYDWAYINDFNSEIKIEE